MASLKEQFDSSEMIEVKVSVCSPDRFSEEKDESEIFPIVVANQSNGDEDIISRLVNFEETLQQRSNNHIGYPVNLCLDHHISLAPLLRFHINNCGDPFIDVNFAIHSRQFKVGVLDWFAQLWEIEKGDYWGYVTNGGTEGNLHGLWIGREMMPDGILYASQESHYSIFKAARMYRMECVKVQSSITGEIDYVDFRKKLLLNQDKPAIINLNIGTTFKGAIDDLDLVIQILEECGFAQTRFYIHCDAALFGLMLPFIKNGPNISFKKPIGSVSISGHKFLGCPMPCGVQITRIFFIDFVSQDVECISSIDSTITGSRNGHSPIFLWCSLSRKGRDGLEKDVKICIENAQNFKNRLMDAGIRSMINNHSIIVLFEKPQDSKVVRRWQISCENDMSHVVVLPNVTKEKLDGVFEDLILARDIKWNKDVKI